MSANYGGKDISMVSAAQYCEVAVVNTSELSLIYISKPFKCFHCFVVTLIENCAIFYTPPDASRS